MDFLQSRTYENLNIAYEDACIASTRYRIFADIAQKDGYIQISNIFRETASQDKEHASIWLRNINQGLLPDTEEALRQSIDYENDIASNTYQEFALVAKEEGFMDIATLFAGIANINYYHGTTFANLYENVTQDEVFCKPAETLWICIKCGNIMSGECAPVICPICKFPQGYYRLYDPISF